MSVNNSREKGYKGEREARRYLEKIGCRVISQNYYTSYGEIDLIAQKEKTLFFVEVKSWNSVSPEFLLNSITREKRRRIFQSSQVFLQSYPEYADYQLQFDVLFIKGKDITYYPASLEADDLELS